MNSNDVTIIQKDEDTTIYGLTMKSSDKTQGKDISNLCNKFYSQLNKAPKKVFPFYVLSKDYNEATQEFQLFVASEHKFDNADTIVLPKGKYAVITIRPKLKFFWGPAIGQAKMYFYTKWLPASNYEALNMEYECHTEESIQKKPYIKLYFAIK